VLVNGSSSPVVSLKSPSAPPTPPVTATQSVSATESVTFVALTSDPMLDMSELKILTLTPAKRSVSPSPVRSTVRSASTVVPKSSTASVNLMS